jgi:hypothetical protein
MDDFVERGRFVKLLGEEVCMAESDLLISNFTCKGWLRLDCLVNVQNN